MRGTAAEPMAEPAAETRERRHDRHRGPRRHRRDAGRGRQGAPPQGGRPPDHRAGRPGPTTWSCPGCCTWRSCAARSRTPRSPASTPAPRAGAGRGRGLHRPRLRRGAGLDPVRLAGHAGHGEPGPPVDRRRGGQPRRRGGGGRRRPQQGAPRPTRSSWSTSTTTRCPSSSTWSRRVGRGAAPLPRPPGVQPELPLRLRRRGGRRGGEHRAGVRRRRGRGQPAVRPAAADPGVHGAARRRLPAPGRQLHAVVVDAGAAHRPADAGDGHRRRRSTSSAWSRRTSVAASAASCR